ncbi:peptidase C56 [Nocardia spumae]|uniref:peptidase C56 n=1 Tax=Nocardia spumae TaxID=2887190 RepID=UPI001D13E16E|nr:peptidase C56 [Nocardia spumae]
MANALQAKQIARLAADGIERIELDRHRDAVPDAAVDVYDALLLRGGTVNTDKLRIAEAAVSFVRPFVGFRKSIEAGETLTPCPRLRADLRNAEADVVDEGVVIYDSLIPRRSHDDLFAVCQAVVEQFAKTGTGAS